MEWSDSEEKAYTEEDLPVWRQQQRSDVVRHSRLCIEEWQEFDGGLGGKSIDDGGERKIEDGIVSGVSGECCKFVEFTPDADAYFRILLLWPMLQKTEISSL